jgi:hypothetical protein
MNETNETPKSLDRKVYAIACRPDLYEIITSEAKSRGMSRSALVRQAVMHFVAPSKPKVEVRPNG